MEEKLQINANRFKGFADVYDSARPKCPAKAKEYILRYLGKTPSIVVDLGCGTGLSTTIWSSVSNKVIGIEPSIDMIKIAKEKASKLPNLTFMSGFAHNTGLETNLADVVTCSQSFHWMDPVLTIKETARILKSGGVFAVYDCDWPAVSNCEAELEYNKLFSKVAEIEAKYPHIKNSTIRWDKNNHLSNIRNSGYFKYVRELVFSNTEDCSAERFIALALSQGGLQTIMKNNIPEIVPFLEDFKEKIHNIFEDNIFEIDFCYRMRIGIK